jgi:hypothetical protein
MPGKGACGSEVIAVMNWAAGLFGEGGGVLVLGCLVGMALLMWLLLRLTGDSAARVGVHTPHRILAEPFSQAAMEADGNAQARSHLGGQAPSGPPGSGSVAS